MTDNILDIVLESLYYFSYTSIVGAFLYSVYKVRDQNIMERVLYYAFLVAMIASYNVIIDKGVAMMKSLTSQMDIDIAERLEMLTVAAKLHPSGDGWIEDTLYAIQGLISRVLLTVMIVFKAISVYFQKFFVLLLKVFAPIMISLAAWEQFKHLLTKLITFTLATCMWRLGFIVSDLLLITLLDAKGNWEKITSLDAEATIDGAMGGMVFGLIVLGFLVMGIFYILSPFIVFTLLNGGNPAAATGRAARIALLTALTFGKQGLGTVSSGTRAALGGSNSNNSGKGNSSGGGNNSIGINPANSKGSYTQSENLKADLRTR